MDIASRHFLIASLLALFMVFLLSEPALAEQEGAEEPRPPWIEGLSIAFSMGAMMCIVYGVGELGFGHSSFWIVIFLGILLNLMAFAISGFIRTNISFWFAVSIALGFIATMVTYAVGTWFTKRLR